MNLKKVVILIVPFLIVPFMLSVITTAEENLTDVSPLSTDAIESVMHPETQHLAADVLRICKEENISAEFIVSVMRWERRPDLHNWFGWTGSDGSVMRFGSDLECLERIIPLIKRNYLTESGKYFRGYTVSAVSVCYNNSDFWRDTIAGETARVLSGAPERVIRPLSASSGSKLMLNALSTISIY